jgi:protocatechuate 3,4-dioxygenase beta subunit
MPKINSLRDESACNKHALGMLLLISVMLLLTRDGLAIEQQQEPTAPVANIGIESANARADSDQKNLTITGICLDEAKKPIVNARVRLFQVDYSFALPGPLSKIDMPKNSSADPSEGQHELPEAHSDENGRFEFKIPSTPERTAESPIVFTVFGQAPGRATAMRSLNPLRQEIDAKPIELVMAEAKSLTGRVTDSDGKPISGALVSHGGGLLTPVPGIQAALSDANGNYEIFDLSSNDGPKNSRQADGKGGFVTYSSVPIAHVRHPDYGHQTVEFRTVPATVDVVLKHPAGVVGKVVLGDAEQPAVDVVLRFMGESGDGTQARTDESGHYKIAKLTPGKYRVSASLKDYPVLFQPAIELREGENIVNLTMRKGGTIKGRIVDVTTGKRISFAPGETMTFSTRTADRRFMSGMPSTRVQADGTFELSVPAGQNYFSLSLGRRWQAMNVDDLVNHAVTIKEGETIEYQVEVVPREGDGIQPPATPR